MPTIHQNIYICIKAYPFILSEDNLGYHDEMKPKLNLFLSPSPLTRCVLRFTLYFIFCSSKLQMKIEHMTTLFGNICQLDSGWSFLVNEMC